MVVIVGEYLFSGIFRVHGRRCVGHRIAADRTHGESGLQQGQAVAIVSAATAMGILVPPCIFMIVLASMTNQSIGAMFVAGFLPAIVIAIGIILFVYWQAKKLNIPRRRGPLCVNS